MTYLELQNQIADDLNRSDLSSQIQTAIKDAITYYERQRFWFNEDVDSSVSTVQGTQTYAVPTDALYIDFIQLTVSGRTWELNRRSWQDFQSRWSQNTTQGIPSDWAVEQNLIYLGATPSGVNVLTISYVKSLATLSASSDSNEWTTAAKELIRSHAESSLYAHVLHNHDLADRLTIKCLREHAMLNRENEQRVMIGTVKAIHV